MSRVDRALKQVAQLGHQLRRVGFDVRAGDFSLGHLARACELLNMTSALVGGALGEEPGRAFDGVRGGRDGRAIAGVSRIAEPREHRRRVFQEYVHHLLHQTPVAAEAGKKRGEVDRGNSICRGRGWLAVVPSVGAHRASIVENRSSGRSGFATYASIPAARHASRSPVMALAVSATIGVRRPVVRSCSRMAAVASNPVIPGICTSMRMMSNRCFLARETASAPSATIDTLWPRCLSSAVMSFWLVTLSSATSTRSGREAFRPGSRPDRRRRFGTGPENAVTIASSRSECLTGGFDIDRLKHAAISNPDGDPLKHFTEREEKGIRPGGFGLAMTRSLVDELIYNEARNEVILIKYLD